MVEQLIFNTESIASGPYFIGMRLRDDNDYEQHNYIFSIKKSLLSLTLAMLLQRNIYPHVYVANCCAIKPPKWKGYSRPPDQSLWASTVCQRQSLCSLLCFSVSN